MAESTSNLPPDVQDAIEFNADLFITNEILGK